MLEEILTAINQTQRVELYKEFMTSLWISVFPEESNLVEDVVSGLIEFEHRLVQVIKSKSFIELNMHGS